MDKQESNELDYGSSRNQPLLHHKNPGLINPLFMDVVSHCRGSCTGFRHVLSLGLVGDWGGGFPIALEMARGSNPQNTNLNQQLWLHVHPGQSPTLRIDSSLFVAQRVEGELPSLLQSTDFERAAIAHFLPFERHPSEKCPVTRDCLFENPLPGR